MGNFADRLKTDLKVDTAQKQLESAVLKYKKEEEQFVRKFLNEKKGHILSFKDSNGNLIIGKLKGYTLVYVNEIDFEVTLDIREEK